MGDLMSLIKANNITNVTGGIPTVKSQQLIPTAWVNFNGTGTVAIRDSEGVSSISDLAAGHYRVTYSTALANANCVIFHGSSSYSLGNGDNRWDVRVVAYSTSSHDIKSLINLNGENRTDHAEVHAVVMGGQA